MYATASLRAARVLVVEDEILVSMMIKDYLRDLGYEIVGPAMRLDHGLELARSERIDFAMLDVNLVDQPSFPIADVLVERGIPFIFATGGGRRGLTSRHEQAMTLHKPFDLSDMERVLGAAHLHHV